jgi:hypothetical protein
MRPDRCVSGDARNGCRDDRGDRDELECTLHDLLLSSLQMRCREARSAHTHAHREEYPCWGSRRPIWILYGMGAGQEFGPALDFAPLPPVIKRAATAAVGRFSG